MSQVEKTIFNDKFLNEQHKIGNVIIEGENIKIPSLKGLNNTDGIDIISFRKKISVRLNKYGFLYKKKGDFYYLKPTRY